MRCVFPPTFFGPFPFLFRFTYHSMFSPSLGMLPVTNLISRERPSGPQEHIAQRKAGKSTIRCKSQNQLENQTNNQFISPAYSLSCFWGFFRANLVVDAKIVICHSFLHLRKLGNKRGDELKENLLYSGPFFARLFIGLVIFASWYVDNCILASRLLRLLLVPLLECDPSLALLQFRPVTL